MACASDVVTLPMACPLCAVTRKEYQLVDVSADGFASLLDVGTGETLDSLQIPPVEWKDDAEEAVRDSLVPQ